MGCKFDFNCGRFAAAVLVEISKHSALIRNLIKLKSTAKLTVQGERVCLKHSQGVCSRILYCKVHDYLKSKTNNSSLKWKKIAESKYRGRLA